MLTLDHSDKPWASEHSRIRDNSADTRETWFRFGHRPRFPDNGSTPFREGKGAG